MDFLKVIHSMNVAKMAKQKKENAERELEAAKSRLKKAQQKKEEVQTELEKAIEEKQKYGKRYELLEMYELAACGFRATLEDGNIVEISREAL